MSIGRYLWVEMLGRGGPRRVGDGEEELQTWGGADSLPRVGIRPYKPTKQRRLVFPCLSEPETSSVPWGSACLKEFGCWRGALTTRG